MARRRPNRGGEDFRRKKKGALKYIEGKHTTARIQRGIYKMLKAYAMEQKKTISAVVEEVLREYAEEAKARLLKQGKSLDEPFRDKTTRNTVFVVSWHGDEKLSEELHLLTAIDGTTIRRIIEKGLLRKLAEYKPKLFTSREEGPKT